MKRIKLITMLSLVVITSVVMVGCTSNGVLDQTIEAQIKQDWQEQFDAALSTVNYYGTHNGYVAFFRPGENAVVTNIEVAGTLFEYGYNWTIYLWKDGSFYNMIDAYEQGLLTAADIRKIGKIHAKFVKK